MLIINKQYKKTMSINMDKNHDLEYKSVIVSDDVLKALIKLPASTVYNSVRHFGSHLCVCEGLKNFTPGEKIAARARTLRFLPNREDLHVDKKSRHNSPEYMAMEKCGPGDVLVADLQGSRLNVVAGDVKLLQLKMNKAEGIVIDGAIRDLGIILSENYNLTVFATDRSLHGGPTLSPAEEDIQIQCGGALVKPGDIMFGDDDGVLVIPSWMAVDVLNHARANEEIEKKIKKKILDEKVSPSKYYPHSYQVKND